MAYSPSEWFVHLFGFDESVPAVTSNFTLVDHDTHTDLTSTINGATYNAGRFTVRNISSFGDLPVIGGGVFNVIQGSGGCGSKAYLSDVLTAQSHEEFDGATFLAASNFNCLEFVSPRQTAASGVTGYVHDHTQGRIAHSRPARRLFLETIS
jgi:hypothetical protein